MTAARTAGMVAASVATLWIAAFFWPVICWAASRRAR